MDTTGTWVPVEFSWCDSDDEVLAIVTAVTVPAVVRLLQVLVLALFVVAPVFDTAGAWRVTFSRWPAVVVTDVALVAAAEVEATVVDEPAMLEAALDADTATVAVAVAVDAAAEEDNSAATTDGDTSVSSGGLGGGVAKPDQHVDGELLLDVTLLAQSSPTSTSTRVDHVVSHGDSERVGEDDTIGSSFR